MQSMHERLRERRSELDGQGGFTLIELLIVIVILGILAAIVVFAVQNLTHSSASSACQSDAQTTDHAVQAFFAQVGAYPNDIAELEAPANSVTLADGSKNTGPWLHNTPTNGTSYSIELSPAVTYTAAVASPPSPASWAETSPAVAGATQTTAPQIMVLTKGAGTPTSYAAATIYNPPNGGAISPAVDGVATSAANPAAACAGV